jgi:hypothetical protein
VRVKAVTSAFEPQFSSVKGVVERQTNDRAFAQLFGLTSSSEGDLPIDPDLRTVHVADVWFQPPWRLREESHVRGDPADTFLLVMDGKRWWSRSPGLGEMSNEAERAYEEHVRVNHDSMIDSFMVNPTTLQSQGDLTPIGEIEIAGRRAMNFQFSPLASLKATNPLSYGQRELAVDVERGLILRARHLTGTVLVQSKEFLSVTFDEVFPVGIYSFTGT